MYFGSQKVAVLRHAGQELVLAPGRYIIGRAPASDLVIKSPLVSRQHARLVVTTRHVTIEDLGSSNGVSVNGRRIRDVFTLAARDRIRIGGDELEFEDVGTAPEVECTQIGDFPESRPLDQTIPLESGTYPSAATRGVEDDGFALVGAMADRALANHRAQDAVDILRYRLTSVLNDARRGEIPPSRVRSAAIEYACKLAAATHDGKWVDYVVEFLACQLIPCPEDFHAALQHAALNAATFDMSLLDRYAHTLRALPPSVERIRATQHAEALKRIAQNKRA
jgi:hypothetical protein